MGARRRVVGARDGRRTHPRDRGRHVPHAARGQPRRCLHLRRAVDGRPRRSGHLDREPRRPGAARPLVSGTTNMCCLTASPDRSKLAYAAIDGVRFNGGPIGGTHVIDVATGADQKVMEGPGTAEWLDNDTLIVTLPDRDRVIGRRSASCRRTRRSRGSPDSSPPVTPSSSVSPRGLLPFRQAWTACRDRLLVGSGKGRCVTHSSAVPRTV